MHRLLSRLVQSALSAFLLLLCSAPATAQVTVNYTARIIIGAGSNAVATADFLETFDLSVVAGPQGPEIPITGSYSFDYPQVNQVLGSSTDGRYSLASFSINGVALQPGPVTFMNINVRAHPGGTSPTVFDRYFVLVAGALAPATGGATRTVQLTLELTLPAGTFSSPALPPDVSFYPLALSYQGNPDFRYEVLTGTSFVTMGGDTIWTGAALQPPPVLSSGKLLGFEAGAEAMICECPPADPGSSTPPTLAGDPVRIATGNKIERATDYATAGPNVLAFTRFYNSLTSTGTPAAIRTLGRNWRGTYNRFLRFVSPSSIAVERHDGQVLDFVRVNGEWISDSDVDVRLVQVADTMWTLTDSADATETYLAISPVEAVLTEIRNRNGYVQSLLYDADDRLSAVTDSYGRTLAFNYAGGRLETLTTPDGLLVTYGYDASSLPPAGPDRLASVTYSTTPPVSVSYLYENAAFPMALTGIIDEMGVRYATWEYDAVGRATSSAQAGGANLTLFAYDDGDGSRTVTNALGQQTVYRYATLQNVPKLIQAERLATATTEGAIQNFTYDTNGYLASGTNFAGTVTAYERDARGLPITITEAAGTPQARTTTIGYDAQFHLPVSITRPGLTTTFTYDGGGNLLTRTETDTTTTTEPYATGGTSRTWTYTWANGLPASVQGPRTDVTALTRLTYTGGALATITNALGQVTQVTAHTPGGRPLTLVDANGVTTAFAYDGRQRLASSELQTAAGALRTQYEYDFVGNLIRTTLPDGSALTNVYDGARRLTGVTDLFDQQIRYALDPLGGRTQTEVLDGNGQVTYSAGASFDALGRRLRGTGGAGQQTAYAYDVVGNLLAVTDPLGRITQQAFDPLNRETRRTDPAGGVTLIGYDAFDRPLSVTAPNGAVTTYVYDGFGNLIQSVSPDAGRTVYRYDLAGNLIRRNDAGGEQVTRYVYDALNRLRAKRYPNAPADDITYVYDQPGGTFGIGRLTTVNDAVGRLRRDYDERGLVVREVRTTASATQITAYRYDAAGRLARVRYPSGARAVYARDALGRVSGVTLRVTGSPARSVVSGVSYLPFGPVSGLTYGNGIAETRAFDLDYRLTALTGAGATAPIQNLAYGYDGADNVLGLLNGVEPAKNQAFGYDALDRLTSAAGAYGSLAWSYDANGNRLTQLADGTLTTYTYAAQSNRLTRIQTGSARQVVSYTPFGNIAGFEIRPTGTPNTGLVYNEAGQLTQVLAGAGAVQTNTYDGFGQRLGKAAPATGTALYTYDLGGHLLEDADGLGQARIDYVYLDDRPIATLRVAANQLSFVHTDRLDTPQLATDAAQVTVWKANYEPFGAAQIEASLVGQTLRFPGQEFDAETGWHHNGFRDYVPALGRYLQSDPIGLAGGINTYGYVGHNPMARTDRRGLDLDKNTFVPYNQLPSNARYILRDRELLPDGSVAVTIPPGYVAEPDLRGTGLVFRAPGSSGNSSIIRVAPPDERNPTGYMRCYNEDGQPISPFTGRTGPETDTHFPFGGAIVKP